jgi:hypothetical protein
MTRILAIHMIRVMAATTDTDADKPRKRGPGPTAVGFVAAFLLSTATIIYTGLKVGAPREIGSRENTPAALSPRETAERSAERTHAAGDGTATAAAEEKSDRAPADATAQ